ncbi:MAG: flagellin, partial [Phycisphaerae bacterium]
EVNGRLITADGGLVSYNEGGYSLSFNLGTSLDAAGNTETFTIKASGGMTFQLGSESNTRSTLGIDAVTSSRLGEGGTNGTSLAQIRSGGSADLNSKSANTLQAIRGAISQVASIKGRIGGFQKFQVETSINALTQRTEALTAARSAIADTDFAEASAELNRQSVLLNSGISLLGLANQQASQILSLLG